MKELKCPQCGSVFTVDEADYASIVSQVKNAEFEAEVERRLSEADSRFKAEQELASAKAEHDFKAQLSHKDMELEAKAAEIVRIKDAKDAEMARLRSEKEAEMAKLRGDKDVLITQLKAQLEGLVAQKDSERSLALAEKDKQIVQLTTTIEQHEVKLQMALIEERRCR